MSCHLSMTRAIWKGCIMAEMSTRHTLWDGYVIASTRLVWVLEILLRLGMMKLISKEEVKKNHKDILGLDLLFAENFPPYSRFLEKCLNTKNTSCTSASVATCIQKENSV